MTRLTPRQRRDLDNYITGHYGEDQFKEFGMERKESVFVETKDLKPSPAAVAAATRMTEEIFRDITRLAWYLDAIAEEARMNERKRIFSMGPRELTMLFWNSRKLHRRA